MGRRVVFATSVPSLVAVVTPASSGEFELDRGALTWPTDDALRVVARLGPPRVESPHDRACAVPSANGRVDGVGWIKAGSEVEWLDGDRVGLVAPWDLPFWQAAELGSGSVWLAPIHTRPLASFPCSVRAAQERYGFRVQGQALVSTTADGHPSAYHLGPATWNVPVPVGCLGLLLSKSYDRFHGRQRARVWVDGELAGVWEGWPECRTRREAQTQFGIEGSFLGGKSQVEVTVDPPAGTPLWSWSAYHVCGLFQDPPG